MTDLPGCFDLDYYFLGFWAADGTHAKGRLRFLINQRDRIILDLFHSHYGGTRSEYTYNNGISYYSVSVSSLSEVFRRANVTLDKCTLQTGQFRFADRACFLSFLLGFIDGDGNVSSPSFHRSTRISVIAQSAQLLETLSEHVSTYLSIEGQITQVKQKYSQLAYSRINVYHLACCLSPYLLYGFRKHELIMDIVDNYDFNFAQVFHSKLGQEAYDAMVSLRRQGRSYSEIARQYGVSKQSAMSVIKQRL
jgi:LysM repeat protein